MVVGDIGTVLQVNIVDSSNVAVNISSATTKDILLLSPGGATLTKAGTFVTDGTDGKLKYTTIAGDISAAGIWRVRSHIVTSGYDRKTTCVQFLVSD